jgi:uncharacterized protein
VTAFASLLSSPTGLGLGGFLIGCVFGAIVYRTNFCIMGALSDIVNLGDRRRLGAWLVAAAVAIVAADVLRRTGAVPLDRAMYLVPRLNWLGHILGGLIFGFGMVLSGGCPTRNLVRFGAGDLRALVVLIVIGIAGFITIGGLIAPLRDELEQLSALDLKRWGFETQGLGEMVARAARAPIALATTALALCVSAIALIWAFLDRGFRRSASHILSGVGVGALVACGWALTGFAYDEFAPTPQAPVSLTYIRPLGDTLDWLQRFTAAPLPGFGIACVLGTLLGAFGVAVGMGRFRVLGFADLDDLKRNLVGAALMGVGGAMALGCTIGQGVTGVSTLAAGSLLTTAALVIGGLQGLKYLERIAGD